MMRPVIFDSNILIDHLNGVPEALTEISYYPKGSISVITWMELVTAFKAKREKGVMSQEDYDGSLAFLTAFDVIHIDDAIMDRAAEVRGHSLVLGGKKKLALPDAIIKATSEIQGLTLITRNTSDFDSSDVLVRVPYNAEVTHKALATVVNLFTPSADLVIKISMVALPPV